MADIEWTEGDTGPTIEVALEDGNGDPISLSGADVTYKIGTLADDLVASGTATVKKADADADDPDRGVVQVTPDGTLVPGSYHLTFEVEFADDSDETFPRNPKLTLQVFREIA